MTISTFQKPLLVKLSIGGRLDGPKPPTDAKGKDVSDDLVTQAIAELADLVRCRCHPSYRDRKLHDPDCHCDTHDAVQVVITRIQDLKAAQSAAQAHADATHCGKTRMGDV